MVEKWCVLTICGVSVPVFIHDGNLPKVKGMNSHYGGYDPEARIIYVRRVPNNSFMQNSLIHEALIHAVFEISGLQENLRRRLNLSIKNWMDIEEDVAHVWSPAAQGTGLIKLPKIRGK